MRVGRYGPYLEDMNHLDDQGNPKRASLPDTLAPDELTVEVGHELIEKNAGGPRALGVDPGDRRHRGRCATAASAPTWRLVPPEPAAPAAEESSEAKPAKRGTRSKAAAAPKPKMASIVQDHDPGDLDP